jgi:ABC-type iron transport system FetAB permease component
MQLTKLNAATDAATAAARQDAIAALVTAQKMQNVHGVVSIPGVTSIADFANTY